MTPTVRYRRPSTPVFAGLGLLAALAVVEAGHALATTAREGARLAQEAQIVATLGLSDLALFTEARYTRHPALADLATAFQDNPASFEHFPSGSFVAPQGAWGQSALSFDEKELRP